MTSYRYLVSLNVMKLMYIIYILTVQWCPLYFVIIPKLFCAFDNHRDCNILTFMTVIGLHLPLDDVTNPKESLLHILTINFFLQTEEGTSF